MWMEQKVAQLIPPGLIVDGHEDRDGDLVVWARYAARDATCPDCGVLASRVHSRYQRRLSDLPAHGRRVILRVAVRRFRCREPACARKTFAEPLGTVANGRYARRTTRTDQLVHQIAIALGGRPGERLTAWLCLGCSRDTLLRLLRRRAAANDNRLCVEVVGVDDWAWRKGQSYGTMICDLERRRVLALLADRNADSVEAWLVKHPAITVVARDRGGTYARAAARGAPTAIQVADRWHLMANASAAFLEAVRRSMTRLRAALGVGMVAPDFLTSVEQRQLANAKLRREANATILSLKEAGVALKEICRQTGVSRGTVRRIVRGGRSDVFRPRQSSLARFEIMLDGLRSAGCHNGAKLHRRLQAAGFKGSLRVVTEWATRRRNDAKASAKNLPRKCPSARTIAKIMTTHRDADAYQHTALLVLIEKAAPDLVTARNQLDAFHAIVRERKFDALDTWIEQARLGPLGSFVSGLEADRPAVEASLRETWSSSQVEGQINRLKLIKRQMYGRAKVDLLEARLIAAA